MNIEVTGLEDIFDSLDEITDVNKLKHNMGLACALVERAAKQKAPKDTGNLRRSITSEVEHTGDNVIGTVFTPLQYAPYVEYGTGLFAEGGGGRTDVPWSYQDDKGDWHTTSGMEPQPFMRPALDENVDKIKAIIAEGLTND
jgi:HK97 gp10 family phage protein